VSIHYGVSRVCPINFRKAEFKNFWNEILKFSSSKFWLCPL
jgi:hypothetical protein